MRGPTLNPGGLPTASTMRVHCIGNCVYTLQIHRADVRIVTHRERDRCHTGELVTRSADRRLFLKTSGAVSPKMSEITRERQDRASTVFEPTHTGWPRVEVHVLMQPEVSKTNGSQVRITQQACLPSLFGSIPDRFPNSSLLRPTLGSTSGAARRDAILALTATSSAALSLAW
jgi:hypothetical protein